MYKSYVLTEDKNLTIARYNIHSKNRKDSITEQEKIILKLKPANNRYSSVKNNKDQLIKSQNLPSIKNISKRGFSIKAVGSTSFALKLPDIGKRIYGKEITNTETNKELVNDKASFTLFCKLYEIWLDIELKFENKTECINLIKFYMKYLKEEVLIAGIDTDDINFFYDSKWNQLFLRIAKIQCIILTISLIVLSNFPDQSLTQLRKIPSNCSYQLITFLDNYIIDNYELKPAFLEKINKVRETLKPIGRNNVIGLLFRNLDYCSTIMKSYMYLFLI
jgi:hypothetical protein